MDSAAAGLIGAGIGAVAGLGGTWFNVRHQDRTEQRREQRELIAGFWAATDKVWRATQSLHLDVFALGNAENVARNTGDYSTVQLYDDRRKESMKMQHEGEVAAYHLLAQLRILYPVIAWQATLLLSASQTYNFENSGTLTAARARALEDFEGAAKRLIEGTPWPRRVYRRVRRAGQIRETKKQAKALAEQFDRPSPRQAADRAE